MPITRLYLIRHGQSEWNRARRVQGHTNSPLTELGHRQAQAVAEALARRGIDVLYASDLSRAHDTALAIGNETNLELTLDPRLREMCYGILEGLTWDEAEERHPGMYAALRGGPPDRVITGGESRNQLIERALAFMGDVLERHPGQNICAATHGGLIAYVFRTLVKIPLDAPPAFRTMNCAITSFVHDGEWRLETWGQDEHLHNIKRKY